MCESFIWRKICLKIIFVNSFYKFFMKNISEKLFYICIENCFLLRMEMYIDLYLKMKIPC